MREMNERMKKRAAELLSDGTVGRVIGWKEGEFSYDITPAMFGSVTEVENELVYNGLCGANVSKYAMKEQKKDAETKLLVFLKPCDSYSFARLVSEHRIDRDKVYVIGIPCDGMADIDLIKRHDIEGIQSIEREGDRYIVRTIYGDSEVDVNEAMSERCVNCKSKKHVVYDELLGEEGEVNAKCGRFDEIGRLESMTSEERYAFWQGELSRCIRCNACRNVCPACTCEQCVFDDRESGVEQKAAADSFEEKLFHIIRAFHVAGRCTDCGECSRVCPEHIPLHLLNRKFIRDIDELYGEYQAGEGEERTPLTSFEYDDAEPSVIRERGNS